MIDFSVILVSYNSTQEQIEKTLRSIVEQKDVTFEIIICDDGSTDNHFVDIKEYLHSKKYPDDRVLFMESEKNQGTVCNALKGIRNARGKYSKLIGVGDLLYHEYTLHDIKEFMDQHQSDICFGLLRGYVQKSENIEFRQQCSPRDIDAYRRKDIKRIRRNIMLCEDWVSGASIFARTDYYLKYISLLEGKVIYCEDWATGLSAMDNIYPDLYDRYVVWYEVSEGISTNPNSKFREMIKKDNEVFWTVFDERAERIHSKIVDKLVKKRVRKKKADNWPVALQLIYKSLANPEMLIYELNVRSQRMSNAFIAKDTRKGFLDE